GRSARRAGRAGGGGRRRRSWRGSDRRRSKGRKPWLPGPARESSRFARIIAGHPRLCIPGGGHRGRADRAPVSASSSAGGALPNGRTPEVFCFAPHSLQGHVFLTPQPLPLELGRRPVAQRGVDPLAVVHVIQESTELAVRVGEVAVLGQIDL